jgi:ssDNA-binding Zn-finger/Zn-ribbon topoisomerase 1
MQNLLGKVDDLLARLEESASHDNLPEGICRKQSDISIDFNDIADSKVSFPEIADFASTNDNTGPANMALDEETDSVAPIRGSISFIRPCGVVAGAPSRWTFPEKRDFEIDANQNAPRIERYVAALRALVKDMKRRGAGMRAVTLDHGESIALDGREFGYRFTFDGDAELFEGAKVTIALGSRTCDGRIVSVFPQELIVSFDEDIGATIHTCVLRIDNTAMIEALADRMDKVRSGEAKLNQTLADDVLGNRGPQLPGAVRVNGQNSKGDLNAQQQKFVEHAVANTVTYLWGPPGTGKTKSLSTITDLLFNDEKRILICSNTNQAVDQVLLSLCKSLGKSHPALEGGRVLRIGKTGKDLEGYRDYVTLAGIVERKSVGLQRQKAMLERDIQSIRSSAESSRRLLEEFTRMELAQSEHRNLVDQRKFLEKSVSDCLAVQQDLSQSVNRIDRELEERLHASVLRGLLMRSEAKIRADLSTVNANRESAEMRLNEFRLALDDPKRRERVQAVAARYENLMNGLRGQDKAAAQSSVEEEEKKVAPVLRELADINKTLESMEKAVVAEARIIGATVTKTYLSPEQLGTFDVVIIDEASMVMLPAVYYVSGLSKEKVIVSGDFRQLSPIIPTQQGAILELIGQDVFHEAGISKNFRTHGGREISGKNPNRTVMLTEQYRMKDEICDLITDKMYIGNLLTHHPLETPPPSPPSPFDGELTVVDTSPIQPFVNRHGSSRYNLMNALAIRNLVRHFRESGFLVGSAVESGNDGDRYSEGRLGVCTPFAAQRDVLKKLVEGSDVVVGTVHRYQGDQKSAMIIDIPDSLGERYVSLFAQAGDSDDAGAKLFNVAVSRAKHHIIFIANLSYLDSKLPADAFLRELLYKASNNGRVVDVRDVLSMWPIAEDLKRAGRPFSLDQETLRSGLFRQTDFEAVCGADIEQAKKSVAIYSGFITPRRVAAFEPLFRRKLIEGVKIRCVTRPPKRNGSIPEELGRDALNGLEAMGCVVDTRWEIHEKVVIIDDEIIWFGSLNPLSHTNRTDEMMARITGKPAALQLAAFMSLANGINPERADGLSVTAENPRCPDCGHRTTYRTGSYGPFWQCEDDCGWKRSVGRMNASSPSDPGTEDFPVEGPPCPKCAAKTVIRHGPHGHFYGCSKYPACKGIARSNTTQTRTRRGRKRVPPKSGK